MIVDNGAADIGGGDHARRTPSNVRDRQQHDREQRHARAPENSAIGVPHSAGLASEGNDPLLPGDRCPAGSPDFSNPVALFNNIFWNNNAFTLDQFGPGATLVDQGFIDFEIARDDEQRRHVHPALLRPDQRPDPGPERRAARAARRPGQHDRRRPELRDAVHAASSTVSGSRLDPQQAAVTITGPTRRSG